MATSTDIYTEVCYDLLEDGGLQLGIVSLQQFLDALNETILDFCQRSSIVKNIYTQEIDGGVSQYTIPDDQMEVEHAFVAGRYLAESNVDDLYTTNRFWRTKLGAPTAWHEDALPIKTIELAPPPDYNGTGIPGANYPGPPNAQYGDWAVTINGSKVLAPSHRGLTTIGGSKPTTITALGQAIPLVPDEWALGYLPFGVLARLFSTDSESIDPDRAEWARQQYDEGLKAACAVTSELEDYD